MEFTITKPLNMTLQEVMSPPTNLVDITLVTGDVTETLTIDATLRVVISYTTSLEPFGVRVIFLTLDKIDYNRIMDANGVTLRDIFQRFFMM